MAGRATATGSSARLGDGKPSTVASEESIDLGGGRHDGRPGLGRPLGRRAPPARALRARRPDPPGAADPGAAAGQAVADLRDEGLALCASPGRRSPATNDSHRSRAPGRARPAIWDVTRARSRTCRIRWDRLTEPADWWPDASAVLLVQLVDGRNYLHRYDLAIRGDHAAPDRARQPHRRPRPARRHGLVPAPARRAPRAGVRGRTRGASPGAPRPRPPGRPFAPWEYRNPHGQRVHGWIVEPDGRSPGRRCSSSTAARPRSTSIAGARRSRPTSTWASASDAQLSRLDRVRRGVARRAHRQHRLARGRGRHRRAMTTSSPAGIADPSRSVIAGWSWGGYITLLMHGMHPERFVAGVAGVPVARLPRGLPRRVAPAPGVRPGPARRLARGRAPAHEGAVAARVRGPRAGAAPAPRRRATTAAARCPRSSTTWSGSRPRPPARAVPLRDGPLVVRHRRADPPAGVVLDYLSKNVPA